MPYLKIAKSNLFANYDNFYKFAVIFSTQDSALIHNYIFNKFQSMLIRPWYKVTCKSICNNSHWRPSSQYVTCRLRLQVRAATCTVIILIQLWILQFVNCVMAEICVYAIWWLFSESMLITCCNQTMTKRVTRGEQG